MSRYLLERVSDGSVLHNVDSLIARDRATTAELLAHLAVVDERKLYAPAGFPSMHAWCAARFDLDDQSIDRRLRAARTARRLPVLFEALADGRLTLSGILILAPHLDGGTVGEWLAAAAHKTNAEIRQMIADRFPKLDVPERVEPALAHGSAGAGSVTGGQLSPEIVPPEARVTPLGAGRVDIEVMIPQSTFEKLRHAQDLLGRGGHAGEIARVLDRALDSLIAELEKKKYGRGAKGRQNSPSETAAPRHIPADVRWAVRERDGGRCVFVSEDGRRCEARKDLEYDHVVPVAKGGASTVDNLRLLCRTHNQLEAERAFGAGFMKEKRAAATRALVVASPPATPFDGDVVRALRRLGIRAEEAEEAAASGGAAFEEPLEERVRAALKWYGGGRRNSAETPDPIAKAG